MSGTPAQKREWRRRPLLGYPVPPRVFTDAEVVAYFGGERVVCLLCGKACRNLGLHLRIHDITVDAYRERYGFAYTRGMVSRDSADAYRAAAFRTQNYLSIPLSKEQALAAARMPHRMSLEKHRRILDNAAAATAKTTGVVKYPPVSTSCGGCGKLFLAHRRQIRRGNPCCSAKCRGVAAMRARWGLRDQLPAETEIKTDASRL